MKKFLLILCSLFVSLGHSQENAPKESPTKAYDSQVEKTKTQWKYNPFRKSAKEMLLFGWQNPHSYITRFWVGGVVDMFPASYQSEYAQVGFTPVLATEVNAIPFRIGNRVKINIGVGFLAELYFMAFQSPVRKPYGNVHMQSDVLNVALFIDVIIDESWRIRFSPITHYCSHISGDFMGDSGAGVNSVKDYGYEGGTLELYYNWKFLTAYGGFRFGERGYKTSNYSTPFAFFTGVDFRIPLWGAMNFIAGLYLAAEYNYFADIDRSTLKLIVNDSYSVWDLAASLAVGLEIDRIAFSFRYSSMRSRQLTTYTKMDQRYGFETTLYF